MQFNGIKIRKRKDGRWEAIKQILLQQVTVKDFFNNEYVYDRVNKCKIKKRKLYIYFEANDTKSYFCFYLKDVLVFSIREKWYDLSIKF